MPAAQAFEWLEVMMAIRLPGVPPMAQASEPRVILWLIVRPWHHAEVPICADLRPVLALKPTAAGRWSCGDVRARPSTGPNVIVKRTF